MHHSRSKLRAAAAVLFTVTAAALLAPSASQAAGNGCRDGAYCLWTKKDYEGSKLVVETNKLFNLPDFINNKASSIKSRVGGGDYVYLYQGKNGNGVPDCMQDGDSYETLGPGLNNALSSTDVKKNTCV